MSRAFYVAAMCGFFVLLVGCKQKEHQQDIVVRKVEKKQTSTIQRIGDYEQSMVVDWKGVPFTIYMERKADTSLPVITDETGNKYYDNNIVVRIITKEGKDVFNKIFTKKYFSDYVDAAYLRDNALLGIVFDCVDGNTLCFAASIGSADKMSDDYVPLLLKVEYGTYKISISKDRIRDIEDAPTSDDALEQAEEDGV